MSSTYEPIATSTLGSAVVSFTFSSIPQTYTDLVLVCNLKASASPTYMSVRYNGDTGSNYSRVGLTGNGSSASSELRSNRTSFEADMGGAQTDTDFRYVNIFNLMNYSNTTTNKTVINRANNASSGVDAIVGLYRSTSAISSITLATHNGSNTWSIGSTFTLYGIKAE
jgi:hypothetical protein